jgi:outer membrane biosynthesis protein TonB
MRGKIGAVTLRRCPAVVALALLACGGARTPAQRQQGPIVVTLSELKEHFASGEMAVALPAEARAAMVEGGVKRATVMFKVCVTTEGDVSTAEVLRSNHAPPLVVKSVVDEVQKWKFSPWLVEGRRSPVCGPYLFTAEVGE